MAVALADAPQLALSPLARRALISQAGLDLAGAPLELPHATPEVLVRAADARPLGCELLFGRHELTLHGLQALGDLARSSLLVLQPAAHAFGLQAALAVDRGKAVLRLDPQLLLGVLALLDAAQLMLSLPGLLALGLEDLRQPAGLLLRLLQALLQAGDVALERLNGRFGGLGATGERRLAALRGAPRAAFGEQIALSPAPLPLWPAAREPAGRFMSLCHHVGPDGTPTAGRWQLLVAQPPGHP